MAARLILNPGKPDEQVFELHEGANTIGRTKNNDVFVLHKSLSRQHAQLVMDGDNARVEDLDSKNGTFVDGQRITRRELRGGHYVKFGDVVFSFVPARGASRPPGSMTPTTIQVPTAVYDVAHDPGRRTLDQILGKRPKGAGTALNLRATLDAERAQQKLQILLKVGETLSSPAGIDETLRRILDLCFQILDVDRGTIVLADVDGRLSSRVRKVRAGYHSSEGEFSQSIVEWVMTSGSAALFADTQTDPRLAEAASIMAQSICASMCAPLKTSDRLVGVIYVDNLTRADRFGPEDLEFLSAFANQAAVAIDNAKLRDELAREAVTQSTLLRFFPPSTIDAIMRGGASLEAIETEATAVFCDISGYTALSSGLSPREIIDLLNAYFPVMAGIVFRHEGTLEKYIGDALLAVWGAPFQKPDDALRAVKAGVDMQGAMAELNKTIAFDQDLTIHVGINTGRVAAGNIGSAEFVQYATIGDATNVAARICNAAAAGEVLIDATTRARIGEHCPWPLEALAPVRVKGKAEPLELFRVRYR
jgi:adenylate cyclase